MLSSLLLPPNERKSSGTSLKEFDYSRRGTEAIFPLFACRSCDNIGLAHFSIFLLEKKSRSNND